VFTAISISVLLLFVLLRERPLVTLHQLTPPYWHYWTVVYTSNKTLRFLQY